MDLLVSFAAGSNCLTYRFVRLFLGSYFFLVAAAFNFSKPTF
jgi:hypothetical protein